LVRASKAKRKASNMAKHGVASPSGWWCNNHLEKYESQWEGLSDILWKIKMFETTNQPFFEYL